MPAMPSIFWFRRDLRLADNPALLAAIDDGAERQVLPLFIVDPKLEKGGDSARFAYLARSLRALDASLDGNLHVIAGDPLEVLSHLTLAHGVTEVHVSEDFAPFGIARDARIEAGGVKLIRTGSPYAVSPGRIRKSDGTSYRVYTPFYSAWLKHGWRLPIGVADAKWIPPSNSARDFPELNGEFPPGNAAGEDAAKVRFEEFLDDGIEKYHSHRDRPDLPGTSRLSTSLRWGEIHPRTLLATLNSSEGHTVFRKEIAWREFYADVLYRFPKTGNGYYKPDFAKMRYDQPDEKFDAWRNGVTGFPLVDAGMRQLIAEGWMHNRVRMIVASFLIKDLHIEWQHGARHFMKWLTDGDLASNSHGWQWVAGCGTDASPYYRIFNPIEQGKRFDPVGDYVRKYIPELRRIKDGSLHEPWLLPEELTLGYPKPIIDHADQRREALLRLAELKTQVRRDAAGGEAGRRSAKREHN
jgi:deoxyribodipyrimidine photo-lyase